jgi:PAS domain S-box-containing protein
MLALTEAEWESTFNAISDWITLITPDGRILRTNNAAESLFGAPTGQVLGLNCFELVHGAECLNDDCPRKRMLVSKKRETTEIPMQGGNGWLQVTVDPIFNSAGDVVSAVHIVRDISERMRSQKAMMQAKKKLNLLNYVTFSDIQNMIFSLSGYQHLAKEMVKEGAAGNIIGKQDEILQKITHSLKFAQSFQDLGLKPPRWQNVNQVFLLAISHLDFLRIHHTVQLDGLEVFADPLLEQVFQILADNTLTHGKTATQVTFRYIQEPESVTLFFEDDGAGIPSDAKEKIFLPDFQKKKGVGLFLAREILDITGITIRETGEPGKGARFEMTVPKGMWRIERKST